MNSIFLVDKESGVSSASVVSSLKKRFNLKKVGHAGTLDPMATGLLVCLVGKATKIADYIQAGTKVYSGIFKLGLVTDSDDITGSVIQELKVDVTEQSVTNAIKSFIGEIDQVPPQVSAIKVNGRRSYAIAREGSSSDLKSRRVFIEKFDYTLISSDEISFQITCSKGTYIRSIARDLGELLGCGACLMTLRREESLPFSVRNAKKISELQLEDGLVLSSYFNRIDSLVVTAEESTKLRSGDERMLSCVLEKYSVNFENQLLRGNKTIAYYAENTEDVLGIFRFNSDVGWKLAVNF